MSKNVVILGAGYAGTALAGAIDGKVNLTVVDRRSHLVHKLAGLRAAVLPGWQARSLVPRDAFLKKGTFVQAGVVSIDAAASTVTLDNGQVLAYDVLVAATGSVNSSAAEPPLSMTSLAEMQAYYSASNAALKKAKSVAIIGGGVVGVELAGEIKAAFPDKEVTIVHSKEDFLDASVPAMPAKFQAKIKKQLDASGIKYVLGSRADIDLAAFDGKPFLEGVGTIRTASGVEVKADVAFSCVGNTLSTSFYPAAWQNEKGQLKVDANLKVEGTSNVFALGDIVNTLDQKLAYVATTAHKVTVAKNVLAVANGKKPSKTHKANGKAFMIITHGPKGGVMVTPFGVFGPGMTSMIKSKSLFPQLAWGANHKKVPALGK